MTDKQSILENHGLELSNDFVIIRKTKNDILNDMDFEDEEERLLCDSIITNMETYAAKSIKEMKVVQLPFIGCVRINPVKTELKQVCTNFKFARRYMTKDEYKNHVRSYVIDIKEKQEEKDRLKIIINKIKRKNKKKYEALFKHLGKAYAEMFIYSIYILKEVPFDAEWEEHYQSLK